MGGGGGMLCPIYCGRSDASADTTPPRTVYVPVRYQPSPPQPGQLYRYSDSLPEYSGAESAPVQHYPSSPSLTVSQLGVPHPQMIAPSTMQGYCPPQEQQRLQVPSLRPQRHSKSLTAFGSTAGKSYATDMRDREDAILAALLNKESELQARIINKQRQLQELRRQLQEMNAGNAANGRHGHIDAAKEIQQLRSNLCDREVELDELRAEMDLTKKETTSLADGKSLSREAQTNQPDSAERIKPLVVKTLREREEENRLLSRRLEALRDERRDLRDLLVQKEQQLATALGSVDPACKESSALQLGMQAISMVQNNAGLKKQIQQLQAELTVAREDHARRELLLEDTLQKLNEKRKEAAGLLELVSQRDMKIARVETFLQHRTRELEQLEEKARLAREQEAVRLEKAAEELRILEDQQTALKSIIASRDEKMLCLQNELVRRDAIIRQLEERSKILAHDLQQSGNHVQQLIRSSAAKDAYMYELEAQLRQNEVQRQASYLAEVARTRHFALETRLKEEECRTALNEKDEELAAAQHDLSQRCSTLQQIRQAVSSIETADACYRVSPLMHRTSPTRKKERASSTPPRSQTTVNPVYAGASTFSPTAAPLTLPQYPLRDSLKALQADFISKRNGSPSSAPLLTGGVTNTQETHQAPVGMPSTAAPAGTRGEEFTAAQPYVSSADSIVIGTLPAASGYTGLSGDCIDDAVHALLRNPRYTPYTPIIRHLSPGRYVVGSNEVQLHVHPAHGLLIQTSDHPREWIPFSTYLERLSLPSVLPPPAAPELKANVNAAVGHAPQEPAAKVKGVWPAKMPLRATTVKGKTSTTPTT